MSGEMILVVDDSPDAIAMLHETLEQAGYQVLVALDGQQALMVAQRVVPDLILLDALMPHMDGFETCVALKQQPALAAVPVIFMTGLSDTEDVVKGLSAGGVDYLTKPVKREELLARMQVHLATARHAASAHDALDNAGHYSFAVDALGKPVWSTPQAQNLMLRYQLNRQETMQAIAAWLARTPEKGHKLPMGNIKLQFVTKVDDGEYLLRIGEQDVQAEINRLRQAYPLTQREAEVLLWLAKGKTNREIAEILAMSPRTVNKHLEPVFRKLAVDNRTTAAAKVIGLLAAEL